MSKYITDDIEVSSDDSDEEGSDQEYSEEDSDEEKYDKANSSK